MVTNAYGVVGGRDDESDDNYRYRIQQKLLGRNGANEAALRRVTREMVSGLYLYTAADRDIQRGQILTRRTVDAVPTVPDASVLAVSEDELKASILLFYSLLDEQQRRLYAGLESLKLGRGGDHQLADFLDLDPHTVARGRQQLLAQDVKVDRVRRMGGGRKPVGKKRPK